MAAVIAGQREFLEAVLAAVALEGSFDSVSASLRETDTALRMTECGRGSAHDDVGQFAGHYDHFHNLLAGDGCLDLFGRQGALVNYFLR